MFHAVEGNQLALVMLFRQCNANLELTNYAGITALMAAQAKGFSEASSVLMVGLDPKAIIEHKEKEKMMMPNKKVTGTELLYNVKIITLGRGYWISTLINLYNYSSLARIIDFYLI